MIRNSIFAAATAGVVAFSIWFQATQTVSHEVKDEGRSGAETSQVEPAETPTPGATAPADPDQTDESTGTETRDETGAETDEQGGKPGETKP